MKVFCDDASVEKAVGSAVEKFNERLTTGNKLALYQIQSASKVRARFQYLEGHVIDKSTGTKAARRLPRNSGKTCLDTLTF